MKRLVIVMLAMGLALLPVLGLAQEQENKYIPDLNGTWKGECEMYRHDRGFFKNHTVTFIIKEQKGSLFHGTKTWEVKGKKFKEDFAGAIDPNWNIQIADAKEGISQGKLMADGVMVLQHAQSNLVWQSRLVKVSTKP